LNGGPVDIFSVIMSDEDHDVDVESDVSVLINVLISLNVAVLFCVMPTNRLRRRQRGSFVFNGSRKHSEERLWTREWPSLFCTW